MIKSLYASASLFVLVWTWFAFTALPVSANQVEDILNADYQALEEPLSPETGGYEPATISAKLGYIWTLPDHTQAMVLLGNFTLKMPYQILSSRDAVLWISTVELDGQKIKKIDIFMEGGAKISEAAGSETSDELLFITISTAGQIEICGESISKCDASNQDIYLRAEKLRVTTPTTLPTTREVIVHAKPKPKAEEPQPRQPISIRGNFIVGPELAGRPVLIGTDGIYLLQAAPAGGEAFELRAKNAVIFLQPGSMKSATKKIADEDRKKTVPKVPTTMSVEEAKKRVEQLPTEEELAQEQQPIEKVKKNTQVSAVYLEGDVVMIRGYRQIRADKVYYDFDTNQALILNAVAKTIAPGREVPIYIRANEIRQLSEREFVATDAKITASEFYTPSYHVGATKVYFEDRTEKLADGEQVGLMAGRYKIYNSTMNVEGIPFLYWPYTAGDFKQAETSIKSVSMSYDDDYGITGKTRWYLLPLLGLQEPEGVSATLKLDYYGDKGPGVGVDTTYERDNYYGLMRSYYIHDTGEDHLGGECGDVKPPHENRGRFLMRHRQYLPDGWELTLEFSYLSDKNFLREFFQSEFEEGKPQETDIYLKKVFGDAVFSILGKWRINDFLTQTEKLPDVAFDVLGKQLGDSMVTWFSENRVGAVRRLNAEDTPWWQVYDTNEQQTDVVARADTRQELDIPATLGPFKLVPYGVARGTAWDDSPFDGGLQRMYGQAGVKGSTYQWRVYDDVESRFWDVHRIKHIMKEDFALWGAGTNISPTEVTPFDQGIETISGADGVTMGWRNRWQTKRGGPGNWHTIDWITLDLEAGFFNDSVVNDGQNRTRGETFFYRPENSITSNYISLKNKWQLSDSLAFLYDAIVDTNDWRMGESGVGLFIERSPRLNFFVGNRYIGLTKSNLLAFGANYQLNKKYTLGLTEEFDLERGENADLGIMLIRRMNRWNLAISADFDNTQDIDSFGIAVWPEGIPEWTIGSRKFTRMLNYMPLD